MQQYVLLEVQTEQTALLIEDERRTVVLHQGTDVCAVRLALSPQVRYSRGTLALRPRALGAEPDGR